MTTGTVLIVSFSLTEHAGTVLCVVRLFGYDRGTQDRWRAQRTVPVCSDGLGYLPDTLTLTVCVDGEGEWNGKNHTLPGFPVTLKAE